MEMYKICKYGHIDGTDSLNVKCIVCGETMEFIPKVQVQEVFDIIVKETQSIREHSNPLVRKIFYEVTGWINRNKVGKHVQ